MPVFLDQIVRCTRGKVAEAKRTADLRELERRAEQHVPRGFRRVLEEKSRVGVAVIAELKKASPSKGLIRADFCVEELARELEAAGAAALSVLTDEEFFQGSLENLRLASAAVKVPCLRKDFIVDEFQLLEGRANSADGVLLIVAALSNAELNRLALGARLNGLDVLCGAICGLLKWMWRRRFGWRSCFRKMWCGWRRAGLGRERMLRGCGRWGIRRF
jgi:indole-3-glycerol phosphate synthase